MQPVRRWKASEGSRPRVRRLALLTLAGLALGLAQCGGGKSGTDAGAFGDPGFVATETQALATRPTTLPPPRTTSAAVGALPGSGWVGHDGSFNYRIPIEVPPGRAGMAPSLALVYSSKAGNGPLGVGFKLEGSSSITRCDKVMAAGGVRDTLAFNTVDDNYCLDGQRLVRVGGAPHGNVGATYRTELDNFTRVRITTKNGSHITKWTAETKDGRTMIYEVLADTVDTESPPQPWTQRQKLNADGTPNGAPSPVHLVWPLTKQYDRSGNGTRYGYERSGGSVNDGGGDEPLLSQIDYTTCETMPCGFADSVRPRRVLLNYELRPSEEGALERWVNGVVVKSRMRLRDIATQVRTDEGAWLTQRTYTLFYYLDAGEPTNHRITKRSLLEKVQLCEGLSLGGPNATCLTPTTFEWQSRAQHRVRLGPANTSTFVGLSGKMEIAVFDANGDGNDDVLLHRPSQASTTTSTGFPAGTTFKEQLLLSDGNGDFKPPVDVNWEGGACKGLTHAGMAIPVDLDANGRTELVVECAGNYRVLAWNGWNPSGAAFMEVNVPGITNVPLPARASNTAREGYVKFADLTGDGLPDMLLTGPAPDGTSPHGFWYRKNARPASLAPAFAPQVAYDAAQTTGMRAEGPEVRPGVAALPISSTVLDLNGNGHQELVQMDYGSVTRRYEDPPDNGLPHGYLLHNVVTNEKFSLTREEAGEPNWGTGFYASSSTGAGLWFFADVNGDGLKDALYNFAVGGGPENLLWYHRINTGEGWLPAKEMTGKPCMPPRFGPAGINGHLLIADLNGDGRDDLIRLASEYVPNPNTSGYSLTAKGIQVCYSNGVSFDEAIELSVPTDMYRRLSRQDFLVTGTENTLTPIESDVWNNTQVGDFNGDGIAEIVDFVTDGHPIAPTRFPMTMMFDVNGGVDLLTKVSDSRGTRQTIGYDTLSSGSRARLGLAALVPETLTDTHSPGAAIYPNASTRKGLAVRHLFDNGHTTAGSLSSQIHLYEGATTNITGRGFLGFTRRYVLEATTRDVTRYDFNLDSVGAGGTSSGTTTAEYYQYPRAMRPSVIQMRAEFAGITELALLPITPLPAATGAVPAPVSLFYETWGGHPLRLDDTAEFHVQQTRSDGVGSMEDAGASTWKQNIYDAWGNVTDSVTSTVETADAGFRPVYTRNVITTFDNTVNDTTWRLGEARKVVETTSATDPYRTGADVSDTRTTEYTYDSKGRLWREVREPNTSIATPQGTNGELRMTTYTRNNAGLVTAKHRWAPTGEACGSEEDCDSEACMRATTGAAFQCWNPAAEVFAYDVSGTFVERFTNALGQLRWVLYDPTTLLPYLVADENGLETITTRDSLGRVTRVERGTGEFTTTSYENGDFNGEPFEIVRTNDSDGVRTSTFTDGRGRARYRSWTTFSGGTGVSDSDFDHLGNVTRTRYASTSSFEGQVSGTVALVNQAIQGGIVSSQASYDRAGRLISSTRGTTEESTFAYPAYGKTIVTDGEGISSSTSVDAAGRVVARTQGTHEIHNRYKGDGKLASITGTSDRMERFYFDRLGRKTQWATGTLGRSFTERFGAVTYDAFDRMTAFSRDGIAIEHTYDALDRVTSRSSGTEVGQTYVWGTGVGEVGHIKRAYNNDLSHDIVNTYNAKGQLTERREKFDGGTTSLSYGYTYGNDGRLRTLRYPEGVDSGDVWTPNVQRRSGPTVQYNYQNGHLYSITEITTGGTSPILWRADGRHPHGILTAATYGSPSASSRVTATWDYYDDTLRLEHHEVGRTTSGPVPVQHFTWSDNGKLSSRTTSNVGENFTYAGALGFLETYGRSNPTGQQLVSATFSYDVNGMTLVDTTASNSSDWPMDDETMVPLANWQNPPKLMSYQLGSGNLRWHSYDSSGRTTRVRDRRLGTCSPTRLCPSGYYCEAASCYRDRREFKWNSFNLPTEVKYSSPGATRTFGYDADGNRVLKRQDADNQVLYMGKLYEQRNLTELGARESVYRLYTDAGPVAEIVHPWGGTSRTVRYLFTDHQGSIAYSVQNRVSTQLGFFPYGKRMALVPEQSLSQTFSQLGYTGHRHDDDLGLIDMGGRIYDPVIRRFLTRDILPDAPLDVFGTNAYAYVVNDPVNRTDPTGFQTVGYPGRGTSTDDCRVSNTCPIPVMPSIPPKNPVNVGPQDPGVQAGWNAGQAQWQGEQAKQQYVQGLSEAERVKYEQDVLRQDVSDRLMQTLGYGNRDIIEGWLDAHPWLAHQLDQALNWTNDKGRPWSFHWDMSLADQGINGQTDLKTMMVSLSVTDVSTLAHELGHVMAFQVFGDLRIGPDPTKVSVVAFGEGIADINKFGLGLGAPNGAYVHGVGAGLIPYNFAVTVGFQHMLERSHYYNINHGYDMTKFPTLMPQ